RPEWAAVVHTRPGAMDRDRTDGLIGWIDLDPAVRPPGDNGSRDVEIVLETGALEPGAALDAHVGACAARIRDALEHLPGLTRYALEHAPAGWAGYYAAQPGHPCLTGCSWTGSGSASRCSYRLISTSATWT